MSDWSPARHLWLGMLVLTFGVGGFGAWAVTTQIDGAVVAAGSVTVEARRQAVQHPDGGLVSALHVREGDRVEAGAPILTLDGTELQARRALVARDMVETTARIDRLKAEVLLADTVTYRARLLDLAKAEPDIAALLADETALFTARRDTLAQTVAQLSERKVQTEAVVRGRTRQRNASITQRALIADELQGLEDLLARGLTESSRVTVLRRDAAALEGRIGELEAGIAEARSSIAGFEVERLRLQAEFREAAQEELRSLQPKEAELAERLRVIETEIGRLVLRAPMTGTVLALRAFTVGGVISPGDEIASIIPADVPLVLSVEVEPGQIDRVSVGQAARLRFPAFNARTTPEVDGHVRTVSADAMADPQSGRRFFTVELSLDPGAVEALGGNRLVPGMPVEAFIRTDARTPASFLFKPVADYLAHALRED
ncbi:HlyD family type I secretion periplasmic adaptor subunit [Anianabacter salinae]|uniref:HlyD family type I secretion periplasmic adaptor subunit n=1 Tax=Anianabacter salinae TaxID=2851023 RepID=UPI00225E333D|nr:HlyD family type I secretion periplasmic adaptor subunit [Anianabacter salinae]MBV0912166.1 HlyD family type I secretion periplasmic adaptor subunit [Anianabacter salinae]